MLPVFLFARNKFIQNSCGSSKSWLNRQCAYFAKRQIQASSHSHQQKGGRRIFGGKLLWGGAAIGSGILAYLMVDGAMARKDAQAVKRKWTELRDAVEVEVGEGTKVSVWVALPRGLHLFLVFLPLISVSVPALALTWLEGRSNTVHAAFGWAGSWMRDLWCTVLRLSLERSGMVACYVTITTDSMERSGAAFIKWGQWAATRPDIFPRQMCESLNSLHDSVPPHAWKYTEESIKKMYGVERVEDVFESCDKTPIGSGSIAQVYKAKFVGSNGWYAVKVRHPGVERQLLTDFALLSAFGDLIDRFPSLRWMGIKESLSQFAHTLGVQVRLDFEAANLDLFNANFRACPHVTTSFPSPKLNCSTWGRHVSEDVLVESFEQGHSVAAYCAAAAAEAVAKAQRASTAALRTATHANTTLVSRVTRSLKHVAEDAQRAVRVAVEEEFWKPAEGKKEPVIPLGIEAARHVVQTGKETYLQMLLVDNFIHADMHPGNIIVRVIPGQTLPELVLIDAGMVDVMGGDEQDNFIGLFKAMGSGDGVIAASHLLKFSNTQEAADVEGFTKEIKSLFEERCRGFGTNVDVGHVLQGVLDALRKHRVRVDGNYATSVVNLLCIESIAAALDPSYNLLDESESLLYAHTLLGRENLAFCMSFTAPVLAAMRTLSAMMHQATTQKRHEMSGLMKSIAS